MSTNSTTSKFNLNADNGLSLLGKIKWIIFNCINNLNGSESLDDDLIQSNYKIRNVNNWNKVSNVASPARRLCDLFWMDMEWSNIVSKLGGSVRALEIGCGTGVYGKLIYEAMGCKMELYRGVDIYANKAWETFSGMEQFEFIVGDASSLDNNLSGMNLIFTQSALEHFENDMTFFKQVADYANKADFPVLQVHLIPSADCISTFPWHGFRQYTPRSISVITGLFHENSKKYLISLGSQECNRIHRSYITIPSLLNGEDFRHLKNDEYSQNLLKAIRKDQCCSVRNNAAFYALVIETNF